VAQSRKNVETKVAWITGGLALAGTVIAGLLATGVFTPQAGPTSPTPTGSTTTQSPPTTTPPPSPTPTPTVPPDVEGHWKGGGAVSENFHLTIASDGSWTLIDGNNVQAGHVDEGKVVFKGSEATFYYKDNNKRPLVVDWTIAKTPTNTVLHLGTYTYTRQ
jgi:hypothetical protein